MRVKNKTVPLMVHICVEIFVKVAVRANLSAVWPVDVDIGSRALFSVQISHGVPKLREFKNIFQHFYSAIYLNFNSLNAANSEHEKISRPTQNIKLA